MRQVGKGIGCLLLTGIMMIAGVNPGILAAESAEATEITDIADIESAPSWAETQENEQTDDTASLEVQSDHYGDGEHSGACGENVFWILENGILTISGSGAMENYGYGNTQGVEYARSPWYNNTEIRQIIIGQGVTTIGESTFEVLTNLTKVTIPNTVEIIKSGAFSSAFNLKSITIPVSVREIEELAFYNCYGLQDVYYEGTEAQWNAIVQPQLVSAGVQTNNEYFLRASRHYNASSTGESTEITPAVSQTIVVNQKIDVSTLLPVKYEKYGVENSVKGAAAITAKGILTAKKAGTVKVFGYTKSENKWVADSDNAVEITVEKPLVTSKTITLTKPAEACSGMENLTGITISPTKWTSSKTKVATIDEKTGEITAVSNGSAKITALYGEGKNAAKYSFNVKVNMPVISKKTVSMQTGANLTLKLKNTKLPVSWSSSDETVATVENGKVTALTAGTAVITATADNVDYSCELTVTPPQIKKSAITIKAGKTATVGLKNTKLKDIEWVTSAPLVATVDSKGKVKGITAGTATISTTAGGVTNECVITVTGQTTPKTENCDALYQAIRETGDYVYAGKRLVDWDYDSLKKYVEENGDFISFNEEHGYLYRMPNGFEAFIYNEHEGVHSISVNLTELGTYQFVVSRDEKMRGEGISIDYWMMENQTIESGKPLGYPILCTSAEELFKSTKSKAFLNALKKRENYEGTTSNGFSVYFNCGQSEIDSLTVMDSSANGLNKAITISIQNGIIQGVVVWIPYSDT